MKITIDKANISIENGKIIADIDSMQLKNILNIEDEKNPYKVQLSTLKPKDEFNIGDKAFIILEQSDGCAKVISKEFICEKKFGNSSNWKDSSIRNFLNGVYYEKLANLVGEDNIIPQERDLTSLDGLDDYGTCNDKISLLSVFEYAKYHKILGLHPKYFGRWWTITPFTILGNCNSYYYVCHVKSNGALDWNDCDYCFGVRPFLTLKSSILISLK